MKRNQLFKFCLLFAPLLLGACMLFPATSVPGLAPSQAPGMIHTAAAQTIVAQLTQSAGSTAVAQLTQMAGGLPGAAASPAAASPTPAFLLPATATPTSGLVISTPAPPTIWPTATARPVIPPVWVPPTYAPLPPPPPVTQPCDWVQFVRDVSVSDGSLMVPGQAFSKTWRLRNIGSCAWTRNYSLVFVSGDRMQARSAYALPGVVQPGDSIDLTADFIAPSSGGNYRGYWMLSNASGRTFGFGPTAQTPFWVDVTVRSTETGTGGGYSFVANYCNAQWDNSSAPLPCPGDSDSPQGSVRRLNDPTLETGKHENEPALWTRPYAEQGGWIVGTYPAFKVQSGDRFLSDIGCLAGSKNCNVIFYLDYIVGGQAPRNLGSWHEVYDRMIYRVDVDLSALAGKNVQFILRVENRGKAGDADAFWLGAQIRRGGGPVDPGWSNIRAVQAAIETLARDLNVPGSSVGVNQVEAVQWPDACLGIDQPGRVCAQVVTPGYRIILSVNGRGYEAHTNQDGSIVLWVRR